MPRPKPLFGRTPNYLGRKAKGVLFSAQRFLTKFVPLSLIINDRLVRQIIWSAKTCLVKATVVTSSTPPSSQCSGTRIVGRPRKLNSTTREGGEQECTFESAAARSSRNGVGEFPQSNFHRSLHPLPSSPSSNGRPIVMVPSFISSSHRERWTAPLKSDLHIGSGSRDSGGRRRRRRNYWRSLRRRLPDNKGTEATRQRHVA